MHLDDAKTQEGNTVVFLESAGSMHDLFGFTEATKFLEDGALLNLQAIGTRDMRQSYICSFQGQRIIFVVHAEGC